MLIATTPATYRPPVWGEVAVNRAKLRELVAETIPGFEAVPVTHDSSEDTLRRIREGYVIREKYRPQLEANGSVQPGEDLAGTVFASMQFRPRGSTEPVLGMHRYGDVVIHWRPALLGGATTLAPIVTGSVDRHNEVGGGLRAGTSRDMVEIVTDALVAQHGRSPLSSGFNTWLPTLLDQPREQALASVAALLTGERFHAQGPEAILRGATATADAIEAVTILAPAPSPELDEIRAWAAGQGIPVHEGGAG